MEGRLERQDVIVPQAGLWLKRRIEILAQAIVE
jgi:hypothetical protein